MKRPTTETDIQIRFADVDMLGHVNNVNLQHYFDLGKTHYFRTVLDKGPDWQGVGVITASVKTDFYGQTRPTDQVYVESQIESVGNKSFVFLQRLLSRKTGTLLAESRAVQVGFDFASQTTVSIPDDWKAKFGF